VRYFSNAGPIMNPGAKQDRRDRWRGTSGFPLQTLDQRLTRRRV